MMKEMRVLNYNFTAELVKLPGKIQWTVFYVPFSVSDAFGTSSRVNVRVLIDGNEFRCTLLPSKNGHYLPFNNEMKDACRKGLGDTVEVILERDDEERTVDLPEDLASVLREHPVQLMRFEKLPAYIRREEINKIIGAKKAETRTNRIEALLGKLSKME